MTLEEFKKVISYLVELNQLGNKGDLFINNEELKAYDEGDDNKDITPSKEVIDAILPMIEEQDRLREVYKARIEGYGELGNQLDMIFKDIAAGKLDKTGTFYLHIDKVKKDNPK